MYRSPMELRDLVQVYNDKKNKDQGPECDYGFKLIIIGDAGAGKSSFMHQFLEGKFRKQSTHTIGVEFGTKIISLGNRQIKLQIWDTAGQERYRAVTRSYYRGAVGALILYDVTSRDSYNNLPTWLQDAREQAWKDISIIAVGNKRDLKEERQARPSVSFLEASRFAQEQDILFLETSALTGENVQDVFHTLAQRILNKVEEGICDPTDSRIGSQSTSDFDGRLDDNARNQRGFCRCGLPRCVTG
uniref:Ras-related protein Rab-4 n=1 Tax=Alexandrium catenella TaxID=2925 RepID=A0A7S1Q0F4_ALECA